MIKFVEVLSLYYLIGVSTGLWYLSDPDRRQAVLFWIEMQNDLRSQLPEWFNLVMVINVFGWRWLPAMIAHFFGDD